MRSVSVQLRHSVPRQLDKQPGVPKEETGVWGSQEDREGSGILKEKERTKDFFLSTFLSLSHIKYFFI